MAISERTEIVAVGTATSFLQWTPVFAGALVASAVSLVLIAFGTALGTAVVAKGSFGWRDGLKAFRRGFQSVNLYNHKSHVLSVANVCHVGISVTRFQIKRDRNRLS